MKQLVLTLCLGLSCLCANAAEFKADLTDFLIPPVSYKQTPASLEKSFSNEGYKRNPYFSWLNEEKTRAIFKRNRGSNLTIDLTILNGSVPIDEMVIDFSNDAFIGCTISVFNRGDSGKLNTTEFERRNTEISKALTDILKTNPRKREGNPKKGILTSGLVWRSPRGMAVLEYNVEAPKTIEFLRLRLGHYQAKGIYEAAMSDRSIASVRKSQLNRNVVKDGNVTYIKNIPMVDQGAKGYCVVASVQRIFEYYGISCDMHQLAQIANSDPESGTDSIETNKQLGAIDFLFKTHYKCVAIKNGPSFHEIKDEQYVGKKVKTSTLEKTIFSSIDNGIPLLWSLELGRYPEQPPLHEQTAGGHMRLITGYNAKDGELYFSDSWGAGHEHKKMKLRDALAATSGLFLMTPTQN